MGGKARPPVGSRAAGRAAVVGYFDPPNKRGGRRLGRRDPGDGAGMGPAAHHIGHRDSLLLSRERDTPAKYPSAPAVDETQSSRSVPSVCPLAARSERVRRRIGARGALGAPPPHDGNRGRLSSSSARNHSSLAHSTTTGPPARWGLAGGGLASSRPARSPRAGRDREGRNGPPTGVARTGDEMPLIFRKTSKDHKLRTIT
jgi:hypothetical protein